VTTNLICCALRPGPGGVRGSCRRCACDSTSAGYILFTIRGPAHFAHLLPILEKKTCNNLNLVWSPVVVVAACTYTVIILLHAVTPRCTAQARKCPPHIEGASTLATAPLGSMSCFRSSVDAHIVVSRQITVFNGIDNLGAISRSNPMK